jgi:hypothetical protein
VAQSLPALDVPPVDVVRTGPLARRPARSQRSDKKRSGISSG